MVKVISYENLYGFNEYHSVKLDKYTITIGDTRYLPLDVVKSKEVEI